MRDERGLNERRHKKINCYLFDLTRPKSFP
jgi:hypothetical protein